MVERGSNTSDSIVSCRSMTQIMYVMFSVESFFVVCVKGYFVTVQKNFVLPMLVFLSLSLSLSLSIFCPDITVENTFHRAGTTMD